MTPEFAYFLKVNVAFALFYAFYRLFFYKDTFFKLRRIILLAFFGLAILYPLLNIQEWVKQQQPIADVIYIYSAMLPEVTVEMGGNMTVDWLGWIAKSMIFVYWGVLILLCMRFLTQLCSILWQAHSSERRVIHGIPVCALGKPAGPFSFFRLIFLYPDSHSEKEMGEILAHELTHVSQWHSVDVIVSELICTVCWFNPFIWLLKREVRHNLEYLADNTVIQSGYDSKSYQYHLLGLAHHQPATTLYNSFNVLHLKNRILMMNKKRSRGIWRAKYLMFIPLAGVLMLLSNMETVARLTARLAQEVSDHGDMMNVKATLVDEDGNPLTAASVVEIGGTNGTITDTDGNFALDVKGSSVLRVNSPGKKQLEIAAADVRPGSSLTLSAIKPKPYKQVFTVVEVMPRFPGGDSELLKFIASSVRYPKEALANGEEGRVICAFVVEPDGSISDATVLRGVSPLLDAEALRLIGSMPEWAPGTQRGIPVPVKYTVPITFRLQGKPGEGKSNDYLTVVDEIPRFPGGEKKLLKYIAENIKYPASARHSGEQGRVICSFVVDKNGRVVDEKIERGVSPSLNEEALRVIRTFPRWTPGRLDGKPVRVLYKVPITFKLA